MEYTSIISGVVASHEQEDVVGSYQRRRVQLAPGNYSATLQALNPQDMNSVISVVYQVRCWGWVMMEACALCVLLGVLHLCPSEGEALCLLYL